MKKKFLTLLTLGLLIGSPVFAADGGSALDGAGAAPDIRNDFYAYSRALIESIRSGGKLQEDDAVSIAKTMISNADRTLDEMAVSVLNNLTQARQAEADFKTIAGFEENLAKATRGKKSRNKPFTLDKDGLLRVYRMEKKQVQDFPKDVEVLLTKYTAEKTYFQRNPGNKKSKGPDPRVAALTIIIAELKAIQIAFRSEAGQAKIAKHKAETEAAQARIAKIEAAGTKMEQDRKTAKKEADKKRTEEKLAQALEELATLKKEVKKEFSKFTRIQKRILDYFPKKNATAETIFKQLPIIKSYIQQARVDLEKATIEATEKMEAFTIDTKTLQELIPQTFKNDSLLLAENMIKLNIAKKNTVLSSAIQQVEEIWDAITKHNIATLQSSGNLSQYNALKRTTLSKVATLETKQEAQKTLEAEEARLTREATDMSSTHKDRISFIKDITELTRLKPKVVARVSFCPINGFDHPEQCCVIKTDFKHPDSEFKIMDNLHEIINHLQSNLIERGEFTLTSDTSEAMTTLKNIVDALNELGIEGQERHAILEQTHSLIGHGWKHA